MKIYKSIQSLGKFEICLWLVSALSVTLAFLLPASKDVLTLIASLLGVTALIFVAKGMVLGQVLTVAFALFYGVISLYFKYYGEMITYLGMTAPIAILSIISWVKHPYGTTNEVAVGRMNTRTTLVMFIITAIVTIAFYFILGALGNSNLTFSTLSVATSFLASYLAFMRSPYYALAYAANDIVLIVLWSLACTHNISYLPMVVCFAMFFINDLYGLFNWFKMRKRQESESKTLE